MLVTGSGQLHRAARPCTGIVSKAGAASFTLSGNRRQRVHCQHPASTPAVHLEGCQCATCLDQIGALLPPSACYQAGADNCTQSGVVRRQFLSAGKWQSTLLQPHCTASRTLHLCFILTAQLWVAQGLGCGLGCPQAGSGPCSGICPEQPT
jgi:hypothetical protein